MYINSYGGAGFEGASIYNQLRRHPAQVTVYIDGFACSVASVIAMAGPTASAPKAVSWPLLSFYGALRLRKIFCDKMLVGPRLVDLPCAGGPLHIVVGVSLTR